MGICTHRITNSASLLLFDLIKYSGYGVFFIKRRVDGVTHLSEKIRG